MSVFARIAGGIYTKAADVGADLVGKVEAGIPEDDPRNPAVIADNVGDNVGDCAGMAADLYETYTVTLVAAMLLAKTVFGADSPWVEFPLLLGGISIIASIIGTFAVKLGKSQYIMGALYKGLAVSGVLAAITFYIVTGEFLKGVDAASMATHPSFTQMNVFLMALIGLALTGLIVAITEYFTAEEYRPGEAHCTSQSDRPWHKRYRRSCSQHEVNRSSCYRYRCLDPWRLSLRRRVCRRHDWRSFCYSPVGCFDAFHDRHRCCD